MSVSRLILLYSYRLVRREWRRFVLPLVSLAITGIVLILILLLTAASSLLLEEQARELQGGDVVLESNLPLQGVELLSEAGLVPEVVSEQISFQATLESAVATAPFSLLIVDETYPLYGQLTLAEGNFQGVQSPQLYLDAAGAERLGVVVGDTVTFGQATLTVAGIVVAEPTSLFGGFRFLPRAFMSHDSFELSLVDPALLRAEYVYAAKVIELTTTNREAVRALGEKYPEVDIDIAGEDRRGLEFGLETVSDFLTIAVLITAVLAAVNVYASTLYLVTVERKSLAILLALGLRRERLVAILGTALSFVVLVASLVGISLGSYLFIWLKSYVASQYTIVLPTPSFFLYSLITVALMAAIALSSFVPAVRRSLSLRPKEILIGGEGAALPKSRWAELREFATLTLTALIPLVVLAAFLLSSLQNGLLVILAIVVVYAGIATGYSLILNVVYLGRARWPFFIRSIISQKKTDGLFGVVSFTSLFVALVALSTLSLIQVSLERFLMNDLSATVPTTYVLDVQPSQKEDLVMNYPDLELFSNIGARIVAIDNLRIQDELAADNSAVDRELGREFNLTARSELLSSETVTAGMWGDGRPGEISVDEDFAKRANISLGSELVFSVQGFEVRGVVTSFRSTDSRSGLPFFYFVLSPEDIGQFPSVYFGYSYYDEAKQDELGRYLARTMPNISVIETQTLGQLVIQIVTTLMVLVLFVTLPPLLIATLLIATLVVSSYATRRREGARLRALGASHRFVFWQYLAETLSLTVFSAVLAYLLSVIIAYGLSAYFLELDSPAIFDAQVITGMLCILVGIAGIALYLFKTDKLALRELLSYE